MTAEIYELIFRGLQSKYPGQAIGPHWRRVRVALDGGDGSGNFGHEGRPGKVGGSGEGGGKQQERNTKKSKTADEFFGPAFTAYSGKPAQAINYLLKVKKGHVPAAIYKEGIGNIDLVYGEGGKYGYGLAHIIEEREKDGINGVEFVKRIPSLIDAGILNRQNERFGRIYVETKKEKAVVRLDYDKEARNWLLTAFIKEDS